MSSPATTFDCHLVDKRTTSPSCPALPDSGTAPYTWRACARPRWDAGVHIRVNMSCGGGRRCKRPISRFAAPKRSCSQLRHDGDSSLDLWALVSYCVVLAHTPWKVNAWSGKPHNGGKQSKVWERRTQKEKGWPRGWKMETKGEGRRGFPRWGSRSLMSAYRYRC